MHTAVNAASVSLIPTISRVSQIGITFIQNTLILTLQMRTTNRRMQPANNLSVTTTPSLFLTTTPVQAVIVRPQIATATMTAAAMPTKATTTTIASARLTTTTTTTAAPSTTQAVVLKMKALLTASHNAQATRTMATMTVVKTTPATAATDHPPPSSLQIAPSPSSETSFLGTTKRLVGDCKRSSDRLGQTD